jgi:glycosyltransferase involved in cell wall biosynthesis
MSPRVSLGLPVYNGEAYVAQAIGSILAQDFTDFELVICDNASTDATAEICTGFAASDPRIRYVRNERNIGAAGNYNRAFELSSGEFFKWCAHDDWIGPGFLGHAVAALEANPQAVLVYGTMVYVGSDGQPITAANGEPDVAVKSKSFPDMNGMPAGERFRLAVAAGGADNAMFGLMRSALLAKTSLHRKYYMSDRALLAELAMLGPFVNAPDLMLYNRDHPRRSTRIADKLSRTSWTNPDVRDGRCFEHWSLLVHQAEIAWRHRDAAPAHRTLPALALWATQPFRLSCYALELVGYVSPGLRARIGRAAWQAAAWRRGWRGAPLHSGD